METVITGLIQLLAVGIGAFLGAWLERRRETEARAKRRNEREQTVVNAVRHEAEANLERIERNLGTLRRENELLEEDERFLHDGLTPLHTESWTLMALNFPQDSADSDPLLSQLMEVAGAGDTLNGMLRARQVFRETGRAYANFTDSLESINNALIDEHERARESIKKLEEILPSER